MPALPGSQGTEAAKGAQPVCKNKLILPPVCPQLWNSAPEILKGQFWVPLQ